MPVSQDAVASGLARVAAAVLEVLPGLTQEIWALITDSVPELRGDDLVEKLLDASVEENLATLLHVYENQLLPDEARAPTAAVAYARRLAQRGVAPASLIRAYRVGHGKFLSCCLEQLGPLIPDTELRAAVTERLVQSSFQYIDEVSEELLTVHQQERDRWLLTRTAARASRVRNLLSGALPDPTRATEEVLGYRLGQRHLGAIAWIVGTVDGSEGLELLDRLGAAGSRTVGGHARHLFIPRDESMAWLWLPLGSGPDAGIPDPAAAFRQADNKIRVAVGEPAFGTGGSTHPRAGHPHPTTRPGRRPREAGDDLRGGRRARPDLFGHRNRATLGLGTAR